jgi:hypothetical protein
MKIRVTFQDHVPLSLIKDFSEGFLGLCRLCEATEDPRVLLLHPTRHEIAVLTLQLEELKREGALSLIERQD